MAPYLRNIRSTGAAEFDDLIALFKQLRYDGRGWEMQGIVASLFAFEAVPLSAFYMCFGFHGEMKRYTHVLV